MPKIEDMLKKHRQKIEKSGGTKKIKRSGPTRPWQENLKKYQDEETEPTEASKEQISSSELRRPKPKVTRGVRPDHFLGSEDGEGTSEASHVDDLPSQTSESTLNAPESPPISASEAPISDTSSFDLEPFREAGPFVPSLLPEQTGNKNQELNLRNFEDVRAVFDPQKALSQQTNQEHKLGTNQEQIPGTFPEQKAQDEAHPNGLFSASAGESSGEAARPRAENREHELGTNQDQKPGTFPEHELGTKSLVSKPSYDLYQDPDGGSSTGNKLGTETGNTDESYQPFDLEKGTQDRSQRTGNKNREHSRNVPGMLPEQDGRYREHTGNNLGTNLEQTSIKTGISFPERSGNSNREHSLVVESGGIEAKDNRFHLDQMILGLTGHMRTCFDLIASLCLQNDQKPVETTYAYLAQATGIEVETMKVTFKRLKKRGLIANMPSRKGGRGTRRQLSVPVQVLGSYSRVLRQMSEHLLLGGTGNQPGTRSGNKPGTKPGIEAPSKLVSNLNTTNSLTAESDLSGIESADLAPVAGLGITRKHLQDIKNQKLAISLTQLEDFIVRFGKYASEPANIKNVKSLPALFIKMVQLVARGEDPLDGLQTDEDRLLEELLERKRERLLALKQKQEELFEVEFEEWLITLTELEKREMLPASGLVKDGGVGQRALLKEKFRKEFWQER